MKKLTSFVIAGLFIIASMLMSMPAHASDNTFVNGINTARANQGKPQLAVNGDLQRTAQDKANRMARSNSLTADGYSDSWKGGSQAVAADPAARASELLRNDFLGKQGATTLDGSYRIIGVGEAVSSNGTLFVAINVAPAPYVPSTDVSNAGGGNNTGNSNGGSADNSAAIAAAEARVRAEVAEAKRVADAQAKAVAEAEAKKQAEAQRIADAEAKKKAEAEAQKQADIKKLNEEAEAKAKAEAKSKEEAALAKIAEAEERAKTSADQQAQAKKEAQYKVEQQERKVNMLFAFMKISLGLAILCVLTSAVVLQLSKPIIIRTKADYLGIKEVTLEVIADDDNLDSLKTMAQARSTQDNNKTPMLPKSGSLPPINLREY